MKSITKLTVLMVILVAMQAQAQLFPPWPIRTNMVDQLSKGHYDAIKKDHRKMTELNTEHWLAVEAVTTAIIEKHDRLFIAGSPLIAMRTQVDNFIILDARPYYQFKYPIVSLYAPYPSNMFKNAAIQYRYNGRISTERDNIKYYLGERKTGVSHELRIPEGERVLFTLQALGRIIDITLENAEY